jgi:uncharacterized protein (DUF849 family)
MGWVGTPIERMKVCLNGGRSRADHPGVRPTPEELAASAAAAVAAGAEAVHLHPRRVMALSRCGPPTSLQP